MLTWIVLFFPERQQLAESHAKPDSRSVLGEMLSVLPSRPHSLLWLFFLLMLTLSTLAVSHSVKLTKTNPVNQTPLQMCVQRKTPPATQPHEAACHQLCSTVKLVFEHLCEKGRLNPVQSSSTQKSALMYTLGEPNKERSCCSCLCGERRWVLAWWLATATKCFS